MESSPMVARVYRLNWRGWAFPLFVLAIGLCQTVGYYTEALHRSRYGPVVDVVGGFGLLAGGFILTISAFSSKLILSDDAIEVRDFFSTNRLLFSEIRGQRERDCIGLTGFERVDMALTNIASTWKLEPKNDGARAIEIRNVFAFDDAFYEWFNQIPDLDEEDETTPSA